MFVSHNKSNYPMVPLKLAGSFCGIVALTDSAGHVFTVKDWQVSLGDIDRLEHQPEEILKREGENSVIVKTFVVGSYLIRAVIKVVVNNDCYVRYPRRCRAMRSFKKAVWLRNAGICVETPLAAFWQQKGIFTQKSVYITEYVPQSTNLHWFVKRDLLTLADQSAAKKHFAYELAHILADLHKNGFLHRDAKPTNFLVYSGTDGRHYPMLIDLDGVRRYCGVRTFGRRFRPFAHLAVLRLISPHVYTTDCLRTFTIYCNLTGVGKARRKRLFRRLVNGLAAKRIESLAAKGRA
jgi:serine/threonine protein kinase